MGSDPGGDWLRAVALARLKNFVRGADPINSNFRFSLEKFNGVRPQCRQLNILTHAKAWVFFLQINLKKT